MYEVVVGIDFGLFGSGFAYSFYNKNNIIHGNISGANEDNKVPTEIILDENNNVVQFGSNCIEYLEEKGLEAGHYFKDIKMKLYEKKEFIKSKNTDKELPLKLIIQKVLETIKKLAIEEIRKNRPDLKEEKIKWVVTVPAIWTEYEKNEMMESCIDAGLINENTDKSLFFVLEPEAASLYCSINKDIDQKYFKKGEYYIVCDLGGSTGDIVAHLVGSNNNLNEIHPACGGRFGSNEIDRLIYEEIILKLFGCKDFNSFYSKYKRHNKDESFEGEELFREWSEIERDIKDFKEGVTNKKIENNEKFPINFSLFQDIFDDDIELNDLIKDYNNNIYESELYLKRKKSKKWIIEFPYKIIYKYMKKQTDSICEIINDILSKININKIIFVGGYCYNEVLIDLIKKGLNNHNLIYLQPSRPSLSIIEGAVLFGIEPSIINIRKAKYTIGQAVSSTWNEEKHSLKGTKVFNKDTNQWMCKDCFDKFIEINQNIKLEEKVTKSCFMGSKRFATISVYKTLKPNPTFIFEEGMIFIGKCRIDAGKEYEKYEDREIEVTMKFGGTFIDVSAIHKKSGTLVKTKLTYN